MCPSSTWQCWWPGIPGHMKYTPTSYKTPRTWFRINKAWFSCETLEFVATQKNVTWLSRVAGPIRSHWDPLTACGFSYIVCCISFLYLFFNFSIEIYSIKCFVYSAITKQILYLFFFFLSWQRLIHFYMQTSGVVPESTGANLQQLAGPTH